MLYIGIGFCFLTLYLLFIQILSLIFSLWTNVFQALHWDSLHQTNHAVSHMLYSSMESSLYVLTWPCSALALPPLEAPAHMDSLIPCSQTPCAPLHHGPNCSSSKFYYQRYTVYLYRYIVLLSVIHNRSTWCFLFVWFLGFGFFCLARTDFFHFGGDVENACSSQCKVLCKFLK